MQQKISQIILMAENINAIQNEWFNKLIHEKQIAYWLKTQCNGSVVSVVEYSRNIDRKVIPDTEVNICEFLRGCFENFALPNVRVLRIRNPEYPLPTLYIDELLSEFSLDQFDYVLSTADECALTGFFIEIISPSALREIEKMPVPVMPPGYLNGVAIPGSGRHYLSLNLQKFYYESCFEILFDSPRSVAINAIPSCNYKCKKCQYHSPILTKGLVAGKYLPLDKYTLILEKCKAYKRLASVAPTISGEPLLHPNIVDIVSATKKHNYGCSFATNASLLTDELGRQLLDAGIDDLAFSVDSTSPQLYSYLQGGKTLLQDVEQNILNFQELSLKKRGRFNATVIMVVSAENVCEIADFRRKWLARGFNVYFSAEHQINANFTPFFQDKRWAPADRRACFSHWLSLYLNTNGGMISCGATVKNRGWPENIFETSPDELWRSASFRLLRKKQLLVEAPGYCQNCSCWSGQINTWEHRDGKLICHNQGGWLEQAPDTARVPAPNGPLTNLGKNMKRKISSLLGIG